MKKAFDLNDYIEDIELNGLKGRMVNAPARTDAGKKVNILFIHGHHSSLERLKGVTDLLMDYGNFCLPDMPGFGGMDHLYGIGVKPSVDSLADYMAAFIKLHYGNKKKFVLVGYSFGFLVMTRLLQKYPSIRRQCIDVVAIAGLLHKNDIRFTTNRKTFYQIATRIVGSRIGSWVTREIFLRKWFLGGFYTKTHNAKDKFKNLDSQALKKVVGFEVDLWRINHIPTWCYTSREMLNADLVTNVEQMPLDLISVVIRGDRYFNDKITEKHMKIAYRNVTVMYADVDQHGGSVVETAKDAKPFIPKKLLKHIRNLHL